MYKQQHSIIWVWEYYTEMAPLDFLKESEWDHYGWPMPVVNYSKVHMSFRLLHPVVLCFQLFFLFWVFCLEWDLSQEPLEFFILFYSLPSFLLVVTVSFSFVLFIVFCFNVRSQCKQTKQLSQIIQRSETSVTDWHRRIWIHGKLKFYCRCLHECNWSSGWQQDYRQDH